MNQPTSIVLVGIGGMGSVYLKALIDKMDTAALHIAGAVDPNASGCPYLGKLLSAGVPIHNSLEAFYAKSQADLAIISSPIQFHAGQTILALERGSHVLCEKPAAATVQDIRRMIDSRDKADRRVAVGYQWSFSRAIQDLKQDIRSGILGKPRFFKCLYLWPRDEAYYLRNNWAGKIKDKAGNWILDSPVNNAMAHDLHNIFYILGKERDGSVLPKTVEAELFRAHAIENFDTAALRVTTDAGTEIVFLVSHVSEKDKGPVFSYEFEQGVVKCQGRNMGISAELIDGTIKTYGDPDDEPLKKLWDAIDMATTGLRPVCGLEAALSQTLCLNGIQESQPIVPTLPASLIKSEGEEGRRNIRVEGLDKIFENCYELGLLPSEDNVDWGKKGRKINLTKYDRFPMLSD